MNPKEYWQEASESFQGRFGENLNGDVQLEEINNWFIPFTKTKDENQSYVLTPFNAFYHYGLEELHKMDSWLMKLLTYLLIQLLRPFLYLGRLHKTTYGNNWLFSTILYSEKWESHPEIISQITEFIPKRLKNSPVAFRSLNKLTNPKLIQSFQNSGWLLTPTRQVWMVDTGQAGLLQKHNVKKDLKLLRETSFRMLENNEFQKSDFVRVQELYKMLYIEKYSEHNPQYSVEYLIYTWKKGLIKYFGFVDQEGVLQAVGGRYEVGQVSSGPIVGYNTKLDTKLGLYRLLLIYPLKNALENKMILHRSSGAPQFKKARGGKAYVEYSAVYIDHLPWYRQIVWKMLSSLLNRLIVPYMQKHEM